MAAIPPTFSDLLYHSLIASSFVRDLSHSCAAIDKFSTDSMSRGSRVSCTLIMHLHSDFISRTIHANMNPAMTSNPNTQILRNTSFSSCVNALSLSTWLHRCFDNAALLRSRADAFPSVVEASFVVNVVAAYCQTFVVRHVWWVVTIANTVVHVAADPVEGPEVDTDDDDSGDDSQSWDNVWRYSQLARTLHVSRRRVTGQHCRIHATYHYALSLATVNAANNRLR